MVDGQERQMWRWKIPVSLLYCSGLGPLSLLCLEALEGVVSPQNLWWPRKYEFTTLFRRNHWHLMKYFSFFHCSQTPLLVKFISDLRTLLRTRSIASILFAKLGGMPLVSLNYQVWYFVTAVEWVWSSAHTNTSWMEVDMEWTYLSTVNGSTGHIYWWCCGQNWNHFQGDWASEVNWPISWFLFLNQVVQFLPWISYIV